MRIAVWGLARQIRPWLVRQHWRAEARQSHLRSQLDPCFVCYTDSSAGHGKLQHEKKKILILVRCPEARTAAIPVWRAGPVAEPALCSSGSELLLTVLVRAKLCALPKLCSLALGEERGELLTLRPWRYW